MALRGATKLPVAFLWAIGCVIIATLATAVADTRR